MEELFSWVRNITFYLIFISAAVNLLPAKSYEKYIRLFAGMVLILLAIKPLTGSLRLEDKISRYFAEFSFQNQAGELAEGFMDMENARLERTIDQYQEAVAKDAARMAEAEGLTCLWAKAQIERDMGKETFGRVMGIQMAVAPEVEEKETAVVPVERVKIGGNVTDGSGTAEGGSGTQAGQAGGRNLTGGNSEGADQAGTQAGQTIGSAAAPPTARSRSPASVNALRTHISEYYGLEARYVEIEFRER